MRDAVDATGREIMVVPDWHAARLGYLSLLKDRHTRGVLKYKRYLCECAAERGHLEVLKWARENDCPWGTSTCAYAAGHGHLEVLKWARENGCPWGESTRRLAAEKGYVEP
jgi:hypothetical protein